MDVFYEISSIELSVSGKIQNNKGKDVRKRYILENLGDLLGKVESNFKDLNGSVRPIDSSISKRYQSIGIQSLKNLQQKDEPNFFHFALQYILREKRNINLADVKNGCKIRKVKTNSGEYFSNYLHLTVAPTVGAVIIDRRCNTGPTAEYLKQVICPHLNPADYGLAHRAELDAAFNVNIRQELVKDYQSKLKAQFSHLKNMSFTLARPAAERAKKKLNEKDAALACGSAKSILQTLLGDDVAARAFQDLPVKTIQVSLTLDINYNEKELKRIRKIAKDNILEYIKNDYLTSSKLEFKDPESEVVSKAILRGLGKNKKLDLDVSKLENDDFIWSAHRNIFVEEMAI